jgi:hypothetical protein
MSIRWMSGVLSPCWMVDAFIFAQRVDADLSHAGASNIQAVQSLLMRL